MGNSVIPGTELLWSRLDALYDTNLKNSIPDCIQPELFHYTNVQGLKGIVESGKLWATSAYYLNDSSEIEYGCQLVIETIEEWLKANSRSALNSTPLQTLKLLKSSFRDPGFQIARLVGIYVSCFCENENLLSQWRAYGQAGGYSIGMLSAELELGLLAPGFFASRLLKVNYDREVQRAKIHSLLRDFILLTEDEGLFRLPTEEVVRIEFISELAFYLQELLMDEIVSFKNSAFEEEREWRIATRPRLIEMKRARRDQGVSEQQKSRTGPHSYVQHFRHSKGGLVPYLELSPLENQLLPIQSLRFGPSLDKFKTEFALLGFLQKYGYGGVTVGGSDTPVML